MKEVLADIVKRVAPHFEIIKVTGTEDETKVEAFTENKLFFLVANLKEVAPDFMGEFGIRNLGLLKGLLEFPSYKADDAKFKVNRAIREGAESVAEFEFRDKSGAGTKFRTMTTRMMTINDTDYSKSAKVAVIKWDLSFTPTKAKIAEMVQLAGLLSEVDKSFGLLVEGNNLYMTIGGASAISHAATICLMEDVDAKVLNSNSYLYNTQNFLSLLKNVGSSELEVNFSSRGVIGVTVNTEHGSYTYYLRGSNNQA